MNLIAIYTPHLPLGHGENRFNALLGGILWLTFISRFFFSIKNADGSFCLYSTYVCKGLVGNILTAILQRRAVINGSAEIE